jgi:hypothetical protein
MEYDHKQILELYGLGFTCREIADAIGCNHRSAAYVVQKHGKSRYKGPRPGIVFKDVLKCQKFNQKFIEYLDGLVISDGSLTCKATSPTACYRQSCVNLDWLKYIGVEFNGREIKTIFSIDGRKKRISHVLRTPVYEEFFSQYSRWYINDKKIVPRDLNFLSKTFLINWVYGDGTLVNNSTLRLCTDDFTEKEVDWLIFYLNKNLDLRFKKVYMGMSKKGNPKFRPALCLRDGLLDFYKYIGNPISCFNYKWRYK